MKINLFTIIFFLISVILACKKNDAAPIESESVAINDHTATLTDKQAKNLPIELCTISNSKLMQLEKVNGRMDVTANNKASISCPSGGYLSHTKLAKGMKVLKGQVVATVVDQQFIDLQQEYLTIQNKIHFAEIEYNRQNNLNQSNATSDKALQQANATLQENNILLATLAEKLNLLGIPPSKVSPSNLVNSIKLYSPISGYVQSVNVHVGKYISPSDVMFEILNPNNAFLNMKVYNKVAKGLKIGQKITAYSSVEPSRKLTGKVVTINSEVDENDIVEVHCKFDTNDADLSVGSYLTAEIATQSSLNNAVPVNSVVSFEGKNYVFISLKNNAYEMIEVSTGIEENDNIEILNAKELDGKQIVKKGAYTLLMVLKNIAE